MTITRRALMTATAGAALAFSPRGSAALAASTTATRYNARSERGRQMLAKYAKAVDIMKHRIPQGDPRHWTFQWYTHWIPGPQGPWPDALAAKKRALERVYGGGVAGNETHRALAQAMWDTCQVHGSDPADPNLFQLIFFPPWHRLFVYHFEEIVRGVLKQQGDDDFTLPYWNYLSDDPSDLSIPPEFLDRNSPLFVPDRNPHANAGDRIDWDNPGELNDLAFAEPVYLRPGGEGGFCGLLNVDPHRTVHTLVGNDTNMAGIPYAAKDPLFFVHHCEIDRLWESWCRLPGVKNPIWPDRSFVFADADGKAVEHKCQEADRVALLGYQYDSYYLPQRAPEARILSAATERPIGQLTRAASGAPVRLTADLVRVALLPSPAVLPQAVDRTPERIKAAVFTITPERQLYLVLASAALEAPADIRFNVYLELPDGAQPSGPDDPHYVGTFYFFDVEPGTHGPHASHDDHAQIFNITPKVKALGEAGLLTAAPSVSLRPVGVPNPAARPTLGRINLVES